MKILVHINEIMRIRHVLMYSNKHNDALINYLVCSNKVFSAGEQSQLNTTIICSNKYGRYGLP